MVKRYLISLPNGQVSVCNPIEGLEQECLDKVLASYEAEFGVAVTAIECPIVDLAPIRVFRSAWKVEAGVVDVDMPKARGIQMDKIREVRNKELAKKDIEFMRAIEDGDTDVQATIKAKKQELRDIPQTFDLTTDTPEELKAKWPEGLPKE